MILFFELKNHNMRQIYAIGETLYDIIFKDGQPQAGKPGGAMLNSTVSLGPYRNACITDK